MKKTILLFFLFNFQFSIINFQLLQAQTITPFQYGLREAGSPEEVYRVLLRTHQAADSCGGTVSYAGIDTLRLAIPPEAQSIPLQQNNDFGGVVFVVNNNAKNLFLFHYTPSAMSLPVEDTILLCRAIDSGDFKRHPLLGEGNWLLHIVDSTLWVDRREGHEYGHYREDIMIVHDGVSHDTPAMPYSAGGSRPSLMARRLDSTAMSSFTFGNITFMREQSSSFATYLVRLENLPQATLRNVVTVTPHSQRLAANDALIYIYNSVDVDIDSLTIWGTYSRLNHSGYGILMGNLRNTHIRRLKSVTDWGVFGTNNMVGTTIEHSDFNRFDIHCYGRDVTFNHCLLLNGFNQFSSVFGTISFHSCTFDNFTPVYIEDSYNAYTHFLLRIDSCVWRPSAQRYYLFDCGSGVPRNSREELRTASLPTIDIRCLEIQTNKGIPQVELLHLRGRGRDMHKYRDAPHVELQGVVMEGNRGTKVVKSNKKVGF